MLPGFPRFDFDGALEMSKKTYALHREFETQIPKLREARDAMLVEWKGPYGDYLYRHCLENDIENHSIIRTIDETAYGWIREWLDKVNKTNWFSFKQAAHHQSQWDYWYSHAGAGGWGPEWTPPIETRVVDGRFLEAPRWFAYNQYQPAPHPPSFPELAAPPQRFAAVEPPFVYYELVRDRWMLHYSYQVPVPPPENHGRGARPRQVVPLRPWNLPENQDSYVNSINFALMKEYIAISKDILVSLRRNLNDLEHDWRAFERRSELDSNGSDGLKYIDMVISEMWRTRQFVKKVRNRLSGGAELGSFDISMPEWRSTEGTRRPPLWNHRGVSFTEVAEEIGLVDRYGNPTTWDPDDERRHKEMAARYRREAEYAAYLAEHDRMVAADIAQTIAENPDKYAQPDDKIVRTGVAGTTEGQLSSRRYVAGPWYATDEPILDVPGADYPTYDAERDGPLFVEWKNGERVVPGAESVATAPAVADPVVVAAPAVASSPLPAAGAADEGIGLPATDPTDGAWFPAPSSTGGGNGASYH